MQYELRNSETAQLQLPNQEISEGQGSGTMKKRGSRRMERPLGRYVFTVTFLNDWCGY